MRQGTRTSQRWMVGALAVAGMLTLVAINLSQDGLAWQAGPLQVSVNMEQERGLAIRFQKRTPLRGLPVLTQTANLDTGANTPG